MGRTRRTVFGAVVAASIVAAATGGLVGTSGAREGSGSRRADVVDDVHLNEIQTVGSHNSYHRVPSPAEVALRRSVIGDGELLMEYEHAPLPEQFGTQKVRQIELDVFYDSAGGRYADPLLRSAAGVGPYDPRMQEPGIKVFHIQDVDYETTCLALIECLQQVDGWSDANPGHVPIAILLELKDTPLVVGGFTFTDPEPWTASAMDDLDAEIRSVFEPDEMITPDDVRGSHPTLEEAVLTDGWPTIRDSRGKVLFLMDNGGGYRTSYLAGHPALEGRVIFTDSDPGQPDAAFVKRNDPFDPSIPDLVAAGYVVRTRADADTQQARSGDTSMRDAALASGAQWVSTDYPVPGIAFGFTTDYVVQIPGGTVARCNPVNGPDSCVASALDGARQVSPPTTTPPTTGDTVPSTVPGSTEPTPATTSPGGPSGRPGTSNHPPARPATARPARPSYAG